MLTTQSTAAARAAAAAAAANTHQQQLVDLQVAINVRHGSRPVKRCDALGVSLVDGCTIVQQVVHLQEGEWRGTHTLTIIYLLLQAYTIAVEGRRVSSRGNYGKCAVGEEEGGARRRAGPGGGGLWHQTSPAPQPQATQSAAAPSKTVTDGLQTTSLRL
jgi:hypothetical protein